MACTKLINQLYSANIQRLKIQAYLHDTAKNTGQCRVNIAHSLFLQGIFTEHFRVRRNFQSREAKMDAFSRRIVRGLIYIKVSLQ